MTVVLFRFSLFYYVAHAQIPLLREKKPIKQDNVHTNTESVQCISIVYSICPYKYNQ